MKPLITQKYTEGKETENFNIVFSFTFLEKKKKKFPSYNTYISLNYYLCLWQNDIKYNKFGKKKILLKHSRLLWLPQYDSYHEISQEVILSLLPA